MHEQDNKAQFEYQVRVDQAAEVSVVFCPDAVVKPVAVVVELFAAPVTSATVLGSLLDEGVADVAVEVHWFAVVVPNRVKKLFVRFQFALF